jgi:class 3 adenylate cyclase/HAMP domain-containing protein
MGKKEKSNQQAVDQSKQNTSTLMSITGFAAQYIDSLNMRQKFVLLLVFPVMGMLFFSLSGVVEKAGISSRMSDLENLTKLSIQAVAVVHETQKERGMSVGFVSSYGKKFGDLLPKQREQTDLQVAELRKILDRFDNQGVNTFAYADHLKIMHHDLEQIGPVRKSVSTLQIPANEVVKSYTALIRAVFGLVGQTSRMSPDMSLTSIGATFLNILESTERLGLERAMLSKILAQNHIDQEMFRVISALDAERQLFLNRFLSTSPPDLKAFYLEKMSHPVITKMDGILKIVFDKGTEGTDFGVDSVKWFNVASAGIGLMKEVVDQSTILFQEKTLAVNRKAQQDMLLIIAQALSNFMVAIAFVLFISQNIIGRIEKLSHVAESVAKGDWTTSIKDPGSDELGQLGSTFNDMAGEISRLDRIRAKLLRSIEDALFEQKNTNKGLDRANKFIRTTFGRYMSEDVVANLLDNPEGLRLGGESKKVTVMMTDLRGFTSIGERLPPEEVITMLNIYLETMTEIILKYNGTIIEFLGDGILALFGAPTTREDDAQRAVACVLEMQLAMPSVNAKNRERGFPEINMGGGLNTGMVVAGNIGSDLRAKYGVVGKTINLAARIESMTVGGQLLISESTLNDCHDLLRIDDQWPVNLKGVPDPVTIYNVGGINGTYQVQIPKAEPVELKPLSDTLTVLQLCPVK